MQDEQASENKQVNSTIASLSISAPAPVYLPGTPALAALGDGL